MFAKWLLDYKTGKGRWQDLAVNSLRTLVTLIFFSNMVLFSPSSKASSWNQLTRLPFPFAQPPAPSNLLPRSHPNMTTRINAPEHHGSCSSRLASTFEKARLQQNTTPISTFARRAPSSNLNMWEERVRPQKPQLSSRYRTQLCTN